MTLEQMRQYVDEGRVDPAEALLGLLAGLPRETLRECLDWLDREYSLSDFDEDFDEDAVFFEMCSPGRGPGVFADSKKEDDDGYDA